MKDQHTYCAIMAGGIGSRFWPMSRTAYPKQFLDFLGLAASLIQQTYDRFLALCPPENILVVTNAQYALLVRSSCPTADHRSCWNPAVATPPRAAWLPCQPRDRWARSRGTDHRRTQRPSGVEGEAFHATVDLALRQATSSDRLVTLHHAQPAGTRGTATSSSRRRAAR